MDALAECAGQHVTLDASGPAVGLPNGLMGNSEVGHFTIGTGRVVFQVRVTCRQHLLLSSQNSFQWHVLGSGIIFEEEGYDTHFPS